MLCYSWNVNGLRAVARKGQLPWDVLPNAEVIALQEIKAQVHQLPREVAEPAGWHAFWHSAERPGYSGVGLLCRGKPDEIVAGIGDARFDGEGRVLAARFGNLAVISAYFPNSRDLGARLAFKLAFCARLEEYLQSWRNRDCETLLLGDYNVAHQPIDLARPKENEHNAGYLPEERAWMTRYLGLGHHDVFRERNPELAEAYSWWSNWGHARERNVGWRIDYATVSPALRPRVKGAGIHAEVMGSDHCPVSIRLT
jgi:exodeoxyribonuclease-3